MNHIARNSLTFVLLLLGQCLSLPFSNAQNVSYLSKNSSATLSSKSINALLPVGVIPAKSSVDPNGGANYQIPIYVPPGTNGVEPQISLSYSSMGINGIAGQGWNITGLSAITRGGQSIHFDGRARPVDLSLNDRFFLDGMRLVRRTGSYGQNGATYIKEADDFSRVTSYGTTGRGPIWFKVETKDGIVMEYGSTSDSRFTTQSGGGYLMWKLSKITYRDGNYILFKYTSAYRDHRIYEIAYTGNSRTGMLPYNKILFTYKVRSDQNTIYEKGSSIVSRYLLDKIEVKAGSATVKSYELFYAYDNIRSLLNSIKERGSDRTSLNLTVFKYGNDPGYSSNFNVSSFAGSNSDVLSGDFDGDGYSDFLVSPYTGSGSNKYNTSLKVYKRSSTNSNYYLNYNETLPSNSTLLNGRNVPSFYNMLTSDFTGDGRDDILTLTVQRQGSQSWRTLTQIRLYEGTNTGFIRRYLTVPTTYNVIYPNYRFFFPGDFNGDGVTDYIMFLSNKSGYRALITLGGTSVVNKLIGGLGSGYSGTPWVLADDVRILDFDGDGKMELMKIDENNTQIYTFNQSGSSVTAQKLYDAGFPTKNHRIYLGDFNGDRKTDLLLRNSKTNNSVNWQISYSTGTGLSTTYHYFSTRPDVQGHSHDHKLIIADYNGDGYSDIMHGRNYGSNSSYLDVYYSRGRSFYRRSNYHYGKIQYDVPFPVADVTGDGRSDIIVRTSRSSYAKVVSFMKNGQERLLQSIVDGQLYRTDFDYRLMTQTSGFYSRGYSSTHPVNTVQWGLNLVYRMRKDDGNGGDFSMRYEYGEAKVHREGKGFLGFRYFTEIDEDRNVRRRHQNELNTSFYALRPYRTYHYVQSTGYRFRTESNSHSFLVRPNKSYWMRLNSKTDYLYMEGRTNYHNFTYDSYGNVTTESLNLGGVSTQTTRASYARFGTIIPSQPTSITVTKSRTGQSSHSTTTAFSYNSLGQVTSKREFSGLPQQVTTSIAYNSYGVPTSRTVSTSGSSSRTTTMAYDSKYRFVTRVTNPLGQTSSSVYDEKWGEPLSKTGEDGLTTSYTYDGYGRRKRTTMPEGYSITDTYGWSINSSSRTVSYYNVAHPGRADVRIDFDKLGREKKRRTRSFRTYVYEERTYDSRGRKKTVRAPYKFGESTFTTTYYYDTYDRPIRESNPFGTTNYAYSYSSGILQVSKTEPDGKVMTMRMDASGKRVSSTDNGGTVNYTYNSQDLPTQVRLGSTVISTNAYDVYGRQTSIFDKNGGTTSYTYTGFGELKTQTNGNGHTFSMTYDKLGRMTRRSGPGESRSFSYLPSGRAINKLYYVSNSYSSNNEYYTYDAYGRLSQKRDRVDGQNYYTTFVNDIYGRVTQKTFPSGFRLEYEYDGNGFVNRIKNTQSGIHKVLFTTQSVNGRGQYTSYTLGNNKTSNISYLHGRPIHYSTSGIQDLRMVWDLASGNLTARQDNTKGRYESFTYDSMNRLASSRVSGQPTKSTFYHANGNISLKSDVGTYSYSSARNNAVTKVSNGSGTIPTITQDIRYTPFDQPERIVEGSHEMSFTYGADRQRLKSVHKINGAVRTTRYYFGDYEKQVKGSVTQHLHYVDAGQGVVAIVERKNGVDNYYFTYTDHLGSITKVTNAAGTMVAEQNFDAWGRRRNAHNWNYSLIGSVPDWLYRGYTFHEDLPLFGLINMNGRLYDPVLGRMLSPDNYVQPPYSSQNYNRYSYVLNNPLKFVDPSGEIIWGIVIIAAAVLGTANLAIQAINGEINSLGDGLRAFGAGALAGAALGLAVPALLSVPILGTALKVAAWIHVGTTALSVAAGIGRGIVTGDWTSLGNAFELALGNFYLDGNRNLLGQAWQGISRFTWEFLQTTIGHGFSQISNTIGQIDRVDYFGGATWAFRTNTENRWGVSIGNHINISLRDNIVDFTGDPLLMHEYGHTFDSQIFGIGYLFIVGIPSLISAANATQVPGEPRGVTTHDFRWYEMRANRHAARYFGDKFGVDWGTNFEVFYPRSRR